MKAVRLPAALALAAVLAACGGTTSTNGSFSNVSGGLAQGGAGTSLSASSKSTGAGAQPAGPGQPQSAASDPIAQALGNRQIIQTAQVSLQIKAGHFWDAYNQAVAIATGFGGYLSSSSVGQPVMDSGPIDSGTLVLRVPVKSYTDALQQLAQLGTTTGLKVGTEDVSQQYVDLQARLRNQQAQQAILLQLMQRAQTIQDSIAVQNQLSLVTQEIERIEGQLRYLDSQTNFSTITLDLFVSAPPARPSEPSLWDRSRLGNALGTGAQAFANVVGGMIIVVGFLLPFALLLALVLLVWRLLPARLRPTLR
ncbi:MAG TPA: DUF4349 domain-containing protein [Candidatus Limnocylindrales bacterium]|nr:DUF4349 domain-containing protein [Candidatus Limnocylindrales bacterium]